MGLILFFIISMHQLSDPSFPLRTAASGFDVKFCSRMNARSAREHTMFAPAQLLRNWREQRPSNKGDLGSSVTREIRKIYYAGVDLILISILFRSTRLLLGCVLNDTVLSWQPIISRLEESPTLERLYILNIGLPQKQATRSIILV
jgi:hypothetical protein